MIANDSERRMAQRLRPLGWLAVAIAIPLIGWRLYHLPPQPAAQAAAIATAR